KQVDGCSDLFGLGVILFELLTGKLPFGPIPDELQERDLADLLLERQQTLVPSLRRLNPAVDPRLAGCIERCLAFDPDRRPQSAHELALALRKSLSVTRRAG